MGMAHWSGSGGRDGGLVYATHRGHEATSAPVIDVAVGAVVATVTVGIDAVDRAERAPTWVRPRLLPASRLGPILGPSTPMPSSEEGAA